MRKLVVSLLFLAVVALAGDFGARFLVERAVAAELASSFGLGERPSVDISGFPFILRLLDGSFPTVEAEADNPSASDLQLDNVVLTLVDVRFDPQQVLQGSPEQVRTAGGDGTATLSDDSVTQSLRDQGADASVTFGEGEVVVKAGGGRAGGDVALEEGRLVVSSQAGFSAAIPLPTLGGHVDYASLTVGNGSAELALDVAPGVLRR